MEDHIICTYHSNLYDAIRDGLRKILAEYRRKNEVEIAATLYKEGKITLREAAAIMDAPVRKTLEEFGERGVYLRYGMEEPGRGSWMITVSDSTPLIHFGTIKRPQSSSIHVRSDSNSYIPDRQRNHHGNAND